MDEDAPIDVAAGDEHPIEQPLTVPLPAWAPRTPPALRRVDVIILLLILLGAGLTRFVRLSEPDKVLPSNSQTCVSEPPLGSKCYEPIPTDEVHYIPDSRDVLRYGTESDARISSADGAYVVHPPIGKMFIALGMKIFGDRPFGWRFFGAFFGTLSVLIMYLLALRLWRSPRLAALAATLLALDGLWFVQARVAMLDIYMSVFVLAGAWMLVVDRDDTEPGHTGFRWWRIGAGAMFGLAIATKWAALPFVAVGIAATLSWDVGRELHAPDRLESEPWSPAPRDLDHGPETGNPLSRLWSGFKLALGPVKNGLGRIYRAVRIAFGPIGALVLLPVMIYIVSYTPWFADSHRYNPPLCASSDTTFAVTPFHWPHVGGIGGQWLCYQGQVLSFHEHLEKYVEETDPKTHVTTIKTGHPYYGYAWSWPWIGRPVAHYYDTTGSQPNPKEAEVIGLPNPLIWWPGFVIALPLLIWWAVRRDATAALILAFFAAGWLPYVYGDISGTAVFLFYATPLVPFVVLGVVHVISKAIARWPSTWPTVIGYLVACLVAFVYFYPVLAAYPIPYNGFFGWSRHMWFNVNFHIFNIHSDCTVQDKIKLLCWI